MDICDYVVSAYGSVLEFCHYDGVHETFDYSFMHFLDDSGICFFFVDRDCQGYHYYTLISLYLFKQ